MKDDNRTGLGRGSLNNWSEKGNINYVLRPGYEVAYAEHDDIQYDGILLCRDRSNLGFTEEELESSMNPQPEMVRLHFELVDNMCKEAPEGPWVDEATSKALKRYGNVIVGDSISRDVIVPASMSLHALHYVIQQCFGWQNAHLHAYQLPEAQFKALTSSGVKDWTRLVGLLLRSPLMDEQEQFWDDDYETGSFKTYLRKKYKWPQADLCGGETYRYCKRDMKALADRIGKAKFTVEWADIDGEETVISCYAARDRNGKMAKRPGFMSVDRVTRTETMPFTDLPARALVYLFEADTKALLERLPIGEILAFGKDGLVSDGHALDIGEYYCKSCNQFINDVDAANETEDGLRFMDDDDGDDDGDGDGDGDDDGEDAGWEEAMYSPQPHIPPVADHIFYNYDFGDDWCVRISGSHNCVDLVKQGRVKQENIDEALQQYIKKGLPTCIARDGLNVMDDVGGLGGFIEFLETVNGTDESEKESMLEWAAGMGWSKRKVAPKNVL